MKRIISMYDRLAKYYPNIFKLQNPKSNLNSECKFILQILKENNINPKKIIELGSGIGRLTDSLQKNNYNVLGIDGSKNMVNLAKSIYTKSNFLLSSIQKFNIPADLAISWWTTYLYLSKNEMKEFVKSLYKNVTWVLLDSSNYISDTRPTKKIDEFEDKDSNIKIIQERDWKTEGKKRIIKYKYTILKGNKIVDNIELKDISFWYSLSELKDLFKDKFELKKVYGGYDINSEYHPNTSNKLITLWKNRSR